MAAVLTGTLLAVIPAMLTETTDICVESMFRPDSAFGCDPNEVLLVDNSRDGTLGERYAPHGIGIYRDPDGHNLGVGRSWNVGIRRVLEQQLDYAVLVSASMQFGPGMHTTWRRQMETHWGAECIEASGHSWHLIAFHRTVFEQVGIFDENFYPGYEEGIDFGYRTRQIGLEDRQWPRVWVNALSQGVALHLPHVSCYAAPLLNYYAAKWGGRKGYEQWTRPRNRYSLDWWLPSTVPELAERYGLEVWW